MAPRAVRLTTIITEYCTVRRRRNDCEVALSIRVVTLLGFQPMMPGLVVTNTVATAGLPSTTSPAHFYTVSVLDNWTRGLQPADIPPPQSATPSLHPAVRKLPKYIRYSPEGLSSRMVKFFSVYVVESISIRRCETVTPALKPRLPLAPVKCRPQTADADSR